MKRTIEYEDRCYVKTHLANIRSFPIHNHADFQVVYVLEGELSLKLFSYNYRLTPGSVHILHSEDVHSIESITEDNLVLTIFLDSSYFQKIFPHFVTTVFVTNVEDVTYKNAVDLLRERIFAIAAEDLDRSSGHASRINNAGVALVNILMKYFRGFVIDATEGYYAHQTTYDYMQVNRISRIIQHVYENYPYKISLSELAEKEQISPYYLSHVFQKLVGMNFRDFLSLVRVEMSEARVLSTDRSIARIAQDVGFSDTKYFVKHFYENLGCHPREYRRLYRDKTYGVLAPVMEEFPLSYLESIESEHNRLPLLKQDAAAVSMIELDYQSEIVGSMRLPGISMATLHGVVSDFIRKQPPSDELLQKYQNVIPNESVIRILEQFARDPMRFRFPSIDLFDSEKKLDGVLTANGLMKPLYYTLTIMERMPKGLLSHGPTHIALAEKGHLTLLLFNPNKTASITIDTVIRNAPPNCKLTKYHLKAANSYLTFWSQLNFSPALTDEDVRNINLMSHPDIGFAVLPQDNQYYTSVELEPYDVIVLMFQAL